MFGDLPCEDMRNRELVANREEKKRVGRKRHTEALFDSAISTDAGSHVTLQTGIGAEACLVRERARGVGNCGRKAFNLKVHGVSNDDSEC